MKFTPLLAGLMLATSAMSASAAELMLFDQPLRTAQRAKLNASAIAAGAKLTNSTSSTDFYDAKGVGLPGVVSLEVVYLKNQVVMAQYTVDEKSRAEEHLRRMLQSKYGLPARAEGPLGGPADFGKEYAGTGKYRWKFDKGAELVFKKSHMREHYLTYVNKPLHADMLELLESAARKRAARAVDEKRNAI